MSLRQVNLSSTGIPADTAFYRRIGFTPSINRKQPLWPVTG